MQRLTAALVCTNRHPAWIDLGIEDRCCSGDVYCTKSPLLILTDRIEIEYLRLDRISYRVSFLSLIMQESNIDLQSVSRARNRNQIATRTTGFLLKKPRRPLTRIPRLFLKLGLSRLSIKLWVKVAVSSALPGGVDQTRDRTGSRSSASRKLRCRPGLRIQLSSRHTLTRHCRIRGLILD